MVRHDCGEIPIVENKDLKKVVGVVTDRDIVCRTVAEGKNPLTLKAGDAMSTPAVTVNERTGDDEVRRVMETHQIRRVPVVDQNGACCGIVSLADIALRESRKDTGDLVREVSTPSR
jgi:CBS domain-containing protein